MILKRLISILICSCVLVCFLPAYAADSLTVTGYHADNESIFVYLSGDFVIEDDNNPSTVNLGAVTVTKDGEIVGSSLTKWETTSTNYISNYRTEFQRPPTLVIQLSNPLVSGGNYKVTISGIGAKLEFRYEDLLYDDFSSYSDTNPVINTWNLVQLSNPASYGSADVTVQDGALQIATGSSNSNNIAFKHKDSEMQKSWRNYTIEFDFKPIQALVAPAENTWFRWRGFTNSPDGGVTNAVVYYVQNNVIRLYTKDSNFMFQKFESNPQLGTKYHLKYISSGQRYQVYMDNKKMIDYTDPAGVIFEGAPQLMNMTNGTIIQFDNIHITRTIESVNTMYDGADQQNANVDQPVKVKFDQDINTASLSKDCFRIDNAGDFTVSSIDSKTVQIVFAKPLSYKTEYAIQVNDKLKTAANKGNYEFASIKFKTIAPPFDLESFTLNNGSAKAVLRNNRVVEPVSFMSTIVLYDKNNKMLDITGGSYTLAIGESKTIEKSFNFTAASGMYLKCYVWDSVDNMKTIFEQEIR